MKEHLINAAIQLLPLDRKENSFEIIDKIILRIKDSGLKYKVCPFETVVEGTLEDIFQLVREIKTNCFSMNTDEVIINLKLHLGKNADILIQDKMKNYEE